MKHPRLKWFCVDSKQINSQRMYSRFVVSRLKHGQAQTIGITIRRALLEEVKVTRISHARFENLNFAHQYVTILGIDESPNEILRNLEKIILRSSIDCPLEASIHIHGPKRVTAADIDINSPYITIVEPTQYIANIYSPINFSISLKIERSRGYFPIQDENNPQKDSTYLLDAVLMPVVNVNFNIINPYKYEGVVERPETLILEIWTNGGISPKKALLEACENLIELFSIFLYPDEKDILLEEIEELRVIKKISK